MTRRETALQELSDNAGQIGSKMAMVGFDGFVDKIVHPVKQRFGQGDHYERYDSIAEFGAKISEAAGRSANIEMYQILEKLGGNGPIMANALHSARVNTRYIGALGKPTVHPVFEEFAKHTQAISISDPGVTTAAEFSDGKIMFGDMATLEAVDYHHIIDSMGEGAFLDLCSRADLIAMVNWTMLPNLSDLFNDLVDKVFPNFGPHENRHFFFDLADPAKRSQSDLRSVLRTITRFQAHGAVTLGLNLSEAAQVSQALDLGTVEDAEDSLKAAASRIRQEMNITCVVIHPMHSAACATRDGQWWIEGPYTAEPIITTGAGDHFNAGFMCASLVGVSPLSCLHAAVCFSGFYVRSGKSPSMSDMTRFLSDWKD
ncbi:MAG: PfkB family carbohydrate kinase [Verrucomicrobiota bacterium]